MTYDPPKTADYYEHVHALDDVLSDYQQARKAEPCRHPGRVVKCTDCPLRAQGDSVHPGKAIATTRSAVARRDAEIIDGAEVLDYVRVFLDEYSRLPSESAADAGALWTLHAHCRDQGGRLLSESTARLMLLSAEPGSGKSRVLNLIRMCAAAVTGC